MVVVHSIDDPQDARIADYQNVPDAELLEQRGAFVAEGRMVVRRLLTGSRFVARSLLATPPALAALRDVLSGVPDLEVFATSQGVMNAIAGFDIHRGCLAIGDRTPTQAFTFASASRIIVLEGVANADNIGGVFRNAAAFGVDGVLLDPTSTDPLYRKAIRTSMGAALQLPFARDAAWPAALADLRADGITLVAMAPTPDAHLISDVAPRLAGRRVALVLGHEGHGLSDETFAACDLRVRIPMIAGADSLNVATAAAVALYELSRT